MKKFVSMIMALAMVCALSVTAFAAAPSVTNPTQEVTATYQKAGDTTPATVYSLVVSWDAKPGEYSDADVTYKWNADPNVLAYEKTVNNEAKATPATVKVTVTNYSNAKVEASVDYADKENSGITTVPTWTGGKTSDTLGRADDGIDYTTTTKGAATTVEFNVSVAVTNVAELPKSDTYTLGTVTLSVSAAA